MQELALEMQQTFKNVWDTDTPFANILELPKLESRTLRSIRRLIQLSGTQRTSTKQMLSTSRARAMHKW